MLIVRSYDDVVDPPSSDSELSESVWGFDGDHHTYNVAPIKTVDSPGNASATFPSVCTPNSWRLGSQPTCLSLSMSFGRAFTVTSSAGTPMMSPHLTRSASNLARSVKLSCSMATAMPSHSCARPERDSATVSHVASVSVTNESRSVPTVVRSVTDHRTALRTLTNNKLASVPCKSVAGKRKRTQSISTEKRVHVFSTL